MRKFPFYLSAVLAGIAINAKAEVITLGADICGPYRVCNAVPADTGASVTLASTPAAGPNPGSPPTTITVDGMAYTGHLATDGNYNVFDGDVANDAGEVGHLYAQWHSVTRHVNSGRAHYTITTWYLDFGTFSRP